MIKALLNVRNRAILRQSDKFLSLSYLFKLVEFPDIAIVLIRARVAIESNYVNLRVARVPVSFRSAP